ncbi:MAG: hypothetical protein NVSMB9_25310 [Isosphaeraceae bacterium]
MRSHHLSLSWLVLGLLPTSVLAQESFKIERLKQPPPASVSAAVRGVLAAEGFKVVDGQGKSYAEIWLRKAIPASDKPGAPKGAIQFPFLGEGELIGALNFPDEGHDYRDQRIAKGVYTIRYGLQPVNGDHLGVSTFRDYALLLPASKDGDAASLSQKPLQERSAESAGTSHPAILLLLSAPATASPPAMTHDEAKNTWGAVVPLSLNVKGADGSTPLNIQLIIVGAAAT